MELSGESLLPQPSRRSSARGVATDGAVAHAASWRLLQQRVRHAPACRPLTRHEKSTQCVNLSEPRLVVVVVVCVVCVCVWCVVVVVGWCVGEGREVCVCVVVVVVQTALSDTRVCPGAH